MAFSIHLERLQLYLWGMVEAVISQKEVRPIYPELSSSALSFVDTVLSDIPKREVARPLVLYIIGATEETAIRVLSVIAEYVDLANTELKWWRDGPPAYDANAVSSGNWMRFHPQQGSFEVPYEKDSCAHTVFMLYYSNGQDPASIMDEFRESGMLPMCSSYLIFPIAEYIFDVDACKRIVSTPGCPVLRVQKYRQQYLAPITVRQLAEISLHDQLQRAETIKVRLGDFNELTDGGCIQTRIADYTPELDFGNIRTIKIL